jgi:hypothetical protein
MTASYSNPEFNVRHCEMGTVPYYHNPIHRYIYTLLARSLKMVLDLFTLAGTVSAVGASEAVHQQRVLNREAKSDERKAPFYLDVFCDAQSRKRDEVHGAMIVLRDGKVLTTNLLLNLYIVDMQEPYVAPSLAQRHQNRTSKN